MGGSDNTQGNDQHGGKAQVEGGSHNTTRASHPSAREFGADAKAQRRRDQQRALDRRAVAASAPGASPSPLSQAPAGEGTRGTEHRGVEEEDPDDAHAAEGNPKAASGKDEGRRAGRARPVAAGATWLDVADLHIEGGTRDATLSPDLHSLGGLAEPKNGDALAVDGGGASSGQTWSLAYSGKAAMADGAVWDFDYEQPADEAEGKAEADVNDKGKALDVALYALQELLEASRHCCPCFVGGDPRPLRRITHTRLDRGRYLRFSLAKMRRNTIAWKPTSHDSDFFVTTSYPSSPAARSRWPPRDEGHAVGDHRANRLPAARKRRTPSHRHPSAHIRLSPRRVPPPRAEGSPAAAARVA